MRYIHNDRQSTGFVLPLLALRTQDKPCGEFPDLEKLAVLAKKWGMNLIQILPVNDSGWQASPYSALSSIALNPIYLSIKDLPEFEQLSPALCGSLTQMNAQLALHKRVPYGEVLDAKLKILSQAWEEISSPSFSNRTGVLSVLEGWVKENEWVRPYGCFLELKKRFGGLPWWNWPEYATVRQDDIETLLSDSSFAKQVDFWAWVQMRAYWQFENACTLVHAMGIDLMGDIPILMNRDSVDAWYDRQIFDFDFFAGAPPDAGSPPGQNWGFPLYRWDVIEKTGWAFWKTRLEAADHFYSSYRIDHVLGFFRIWAVGKAERDGYLGHFEPEMDYTREELHELGFSDERIQWLSQPHIPESAVEAIFALLKAAHDESNALPQQDTAKFRSVLFSQIGTEPLYRFSGQIQGSADFDRLVRDFLPTSGTNGVSYGAQNEKALKSSLVSWWRNRSLLELPNGHFIAAPNYWNTQAWCSLSDDERQELKSLIERKGEISNKLWLENGRKILSAITGHVTMQPCAEDLGFLSPGVPQTLDDLNIPGLRVLRWTRYYEEPGAPFVPPDKYPANSVACTSVHDSSTLREWWRDEPDKAKLWDVLQLPGSCPDDLDPAAALQVVRAFAMVNSRFLVYPLQDLLACDEHYREENPKDERINIPGTCDDFDWTYRMKPSIEGLLPDGGFSSRISSLSKVHSMLRSKV